jgi:hypothetical protein
MATFETSPTAVEAASTGGAQSQAQNFEGFSEAQRESLQNLDNQLNPEVETEASLEVNPEDEAQLREALNKSQEDLQARLEALKEANPGMDVSKATLGDIYSQEEITVMQDQAEKMKENGINWAPIWKGAKIVGGVLLAAAIGGAIGYGAYMALQSLGYGPAMLDIAQKVLGVAGSALDKVIEGLNYVGDGLSAAWENMKSWEIWSKFSSGIDENTGDILKKATEGADRGALSDLTRGTDIPDLGGFNDLPPKP